MGEKLGHSVVQDNLNQSNKQAIVDNAGIIKELEKPICFVNANAVNEDVWSGILDIYSNVFNKGNAISRPDFAAIKAVYTPTGGELTFYPIQGNITFPLEVRTKVSGQQLFLRFKAYISGGGRSTEKSERFQTQVDDYLREIGLEVLPHKSIV